MTVNFRRTGPELQPENSGKPVVCGCCCFHRKQVERVLHYNHGAWYVELPRLMGGSGLYEIALYAFCPNCNGFEYREMPTTQKDSDATGYAYVVNDRNRPVFVGHSRNAAAEKFTEKLQSFNNPFGETAAKEVSMHMSLFV